MDTVSTLSTITSSTATAPSSASQQLTYTTAGTLYNPSSSQPLQPPTRRGRSLKWAAGGPHGNLALLPKSFLATLPLKAGTCRTTAVHQYTPLQQNYDRASTPFNDPDHFSANMSAQVPRLRAGDTTFTSFFSELERDKYTDGDVSEESDDESDLGMDPLMNMTVKSLHNLASYPNPNQKRAQKALLRGAKPTLNGLSEVIRNHAPPSPRNRSFQPEILKRVSVSPTSLRPAQSDPTALRKVQEESHLKPGFNRSTTFQLESSPLSEMTSHGNTTHPTSTPTSTSTSTTTSMTLASGPGVPQPLTAGPPGQRQYRPSTFESTFKALQPNVASRNGGNDDDDDDENMSALTQHTLVQAGIDDLEFVSDSASSVYRAAGSSSPEARPMAVLKKMISSTDDVFAGTNDQHAMMASWNQEHRYHKGMFLPTWTWPSEPFHTNWTPLSTRMAGPWKPGTDRLTDDVIAARNEKINRDWHAGADFLGKTMEDVVDEARHRGAGKTFGAIGDGRPLKTKDKYGPIDVTEANRMSVAEHAKPLLNMAFASVLRHVEVDSCKSGLLQTEKRAETSGEQAGGRASGQAVGQGNWGSQSLFGKRVDGGQ
ncbi:hypothetical protein BKA56DRAFT_619767 [Ilyonectria sp. MPI-CAGE-AT-0026]|nr:hypothetical protein BKA56DRAFT_619767 [Ilyonectria sp. MPI-CAGE-AT-0026]